MMAYQDRPEEVPGVESGQGDEEQVEAVEHAFPVNNHAAVIEGNVIHRQYIVNTFYPNAMIVMLLIIKAAIYLITLFLCIDETHL